MKTKLPTLSKILDNVAIGGVGNLMYHAHQKGIQGIALRDTTEDLTDASQLAAKIMISALEIKQNDLDIYSESCLDRVDNSLISFYNDFYELHKPHPWIKDVTLISQLLIFSGKVTAYQYTGGIIIANVCVKNSLYLDDLLKLSAQYHLLRENKMIKGDVKLFILQVTREETPELIIHEYKQHEMIYPLKVLESMREMYDMQEKLKTLLV